MTNHPLIKNITSRLDHLSKKKRRERHAQVLKYLREPSNAITPSYLHHTQNSLSLFCEKAQKANSTCHHAEHYQQIPSLIEKIIQPREPLTLYAPSLPWLHNLSWHPSLSLSHEKPNIQALWGLSLASSAAAETGTLFLASSPSSPITLNFVPENSIVLLPLSLLYPSLEEAMEIAYTPRPRALSLVTGPSRTADIAQQLVMGAHGPKSLTIILFNQP